MENPVISDILVTGNTSLLLIDCWLEEAQIKDDIPPNDLHIVNADEGVTEKNLWLTRTGWRDIFD